jgi:hypothetical protein
MERTLGALPRKMLRSATCKRADRNFRHGYLRWPERAIDRESEEHVRSQRRLKEAVCNDARGEPLRHCAEVRGARVRARAARAACWLRRAAGRADAASRWRVLVAVGGAGACSPPPSGCVRVSPTRPRRCSVASAAAPLWPRFRWLRCGCGSATAPLWFRCGCGSAAAPLRFRCGCGSAAAPLWFRCGCGSAAAPLRPWVALSRDRGCAAPPLWLRLWQLSEFHDLLLCYVMLCCGS